MIKEAKRKYRCMISHNDEFNAITMFFPASALVSHIGLNANGGGCALASLKWRRTDLYHAEFL
jgi:hypothetical protein